MAWVSGILRWLGQNGAPWRLVIPHATFASVVAFAPPSGSASPAGLASPRQALPLQPANDWAEEDPPRRDLMALHSFTEVAVFDGADQCLGQVRNLSIDRTTGQVVYALLRLDRDRRPIRYLPVPWSLLKPRPEGGYSVSLEPSDIEAAPSLSSDELGSFEASDRAWRDAASYFFLGITI